MEIEEGYRRKDREDMQVAIIGTRFSISNSLVSPQVNPRKKTKIEVVNETAGNCKKEDALKKTKLLTLLTPPLVAAFIALSPIYNPPGTTTDAYGRGVTLFRQSCIGCHDAGGNTIQPGATLFLKDLQRNGIDSEEEIYRITYYGKGRMPGFGVNCKPKGQCTFGPRLQEEEISILAQFVKSQAEQGWPNID